MFAIAICVLMSFQQPGDISIQIKEIESRIVEQKKIYANLMKQNRTSLARDKMRAINKLQDDLEELKQKASLEDAKTKSESEKMTREINREVNSKKVIARKAEEASLGKKSKRVQTVTLETSLSNYVNPRLIYKNVAGGIGYYEFDVQESEIELPRPCIDFDMSYLLLVNDSTKKVIGVSLVANRYDETIAKTATNAARDKCKTVQRDILGDFVGETEDGITILVRAGLREIFKGRTVVDYYDSTLVSGAIKQGAKDSGF